MGGNLEDAMRPLDEAVAAVGEVLAAGRAADVDFVLNARTDAVLLAPPGADRAALLDEAVRRGRAFLAAGAVGVFVPGVAAAGEIAALAGALGPGRLGVLAVPGTTPPVAELERLGVARVSTGPFAQRVALTALQDATTALLAGGALPPGTRMLS